MKAPLSATALASSQAQLRLILAGRAAQQSVPKHGPGLADLCDRWTGGVYDLRGGDEATAALVFKTRSPTSLT